MRAWEAGASIPPEWWKSIPPMVYVGDHSMIHALYLSHVGVSGREEMIKTPIIIEGEKPPRIEGGEVEKLNNLI